jgi:acyl-CoA thioesterase-2
VIFMAKTITILDALELEQVDATNFRGISVPHDSGRPVVEGAQMMAQMMVAAAHSAPEKTVRFISSVFARVGRTDVPLDIHVDVMHAGRTLASATTTVSQEDRLLCRALILFDAGDEDLIRHAASMPENAGRPDDATPWTTNPQGTEIRIAEGVKLGAMENNGPAELKVWFRVPGAPSDAVLNQALLTSRSHLFLIAAAMRPHEGVGIDLTHDTISTGVITHTLSFHEPVDSSSWLLFAQESTFAGSGRSFGRGEVFDESGRHVASFVQDNLIRRFADDFTNRGKTNLAL